MVVRDVDLLGRFEKLRVNFTINTDSESVRLRYEPTCPSISARLKAAAKLAESGVRIGVSISPMLPIHSIEAFGARLAGLNADEYVTQYLKPGRSMFAAGSSSTVREQLRNDNWGVKEYKLARDKLASLLGPHRQLLEGAEGYAPA